MSLRPGGDTPYDAEAAAALGITAVGVKTGGFSEAALRRAGCVAVFRQVGDLLEHRADWPPSMA